MSGGGRFASDRAGGFTIFPLLSVVSNVTVSLFDGGRLGEFFFAASDSTVNLFGGVVEEGFNARRGATVNIHGGTIAPSFQTADDGTTINLFVREVSLGGAAIELELGEQRVLDRAAAPLLAAVFADGSALELGTFERFHEGTTLTVTRVPEPGAGLVLVSVLGLAGLRRSRMIIRRG